MILFLKIKAKPYETNMKEYISENYKCKCFFSLLRTLLFVIDTYDWFQTLLGKNSCLSDLVLFIFTRLSSRCAVIVCLYLWCGSETGLLLAAGRCRDAALGTRSCLRWVLLLTDCVVDTHTVIQPWVSQQTQTPTVGWDRPRVSFAIQLYLLANPDLQMAIARFKTCGTIPSITDGSETLSLSCRLDLPDIENGMCITHTASLLLQDIIMLSLKHYVQYVHPDLKPQRWGEVAQMAAVWDTLKVQAGFAIVMASLRDHSLSVKVMTN